MAVNLKSITDPKESLRQSPSDFKRSHQLPKCINDLNEMEEYATALKNSVSLAMGPVKLKDEFSHRKSSFMVEDIVRNPNFSPCPERRLPDPSFRDEMQTPQAMASDGRSSNMPSSKNYFLCYHDIRYIVFHFKLSCT